MRRLRQSVAYHWLEDNPATGALVAAGLGAAAILLVGALGLYSKETFVTKSACTRDPAGAACAAIRQDIARAEPIRNPCIGYQRVTRTRGRACPKDFIDLRRGRGPEARLTKGVHGSGAGTSGGAVPVAIDGDQQGPTGGVDPGHKKGTSGGTKTPSKSQEPGPPAESPPDSSDTDTGTAPVETVAEQPDTPSPSEQPGLIGNPGGVVGEVVCSVNELGIRVCTEPG